MTPEQIVRELADRGAVTERGERLACALCYASVGSGNVEHEPDCPWRLAVQWAAANPLVSAGIQGPGDPHADGLFAAFVAGLDASCEGFNGEYVGSCHNDPEPGHRHSEQLLARLRRLFGDAQTR